MRRPISAIFLASLVPVALSSAAAAAQAAPASGPATSAAEQDAAAQLKKLFADSDERYLRDNPVMALFRGDLRYADQLGDYVTDAYFARERAATEHDLHRLAAIDRNALNATDRIAYDVFQWQKQRDLQDYSPAILSLTAVRPINHFFGFHTFYPTFASGSGGAPFKTLADYENNLKRHPEFVALLDNSIAQMRKGMATGVVETKMTIGNVIAQLDTQLVQPVEESPYYGPIKKFPDGIGTADRTRLAAAYKKAIEQDIYPAYKRLRDFLANEYLPVARDGVGLINMKGGDLLYRDLIEKNTTLKMSPDEIHSLGLSEVARVRSEMEKVKAEVGFEGTLAEFFDHLRSAPQFKPKSRQGLTDRYYAVGKEVDARIGAYFSHLPKAKLEIRPYEEFREKFEAGGSYQSGTPDGSRPGRFYFNAYDLPSRTLPGTTTLYLHEGAPGHHFQISLAQENEALPNFMRFGGNTAFVEGWALYAETLGYEMGFYKDPYQRFGTLSDEMLRAMRLVVDSGIHAKNWTREQAIAYMLDNSDMGKTDATAEVERYIAIPGQALAYKVGALTIQRLRSKAEAAMGAKFDLREFHNQVLGTGALPLSVLEKKIDDWIATTKA